MLDTVGNLNTYLLILPFAALLNLFLGIIVYIHNRNNLVNKIFLFLASAISIWTIGVIIRFVNISKEMTLFGARITFFGAPLIALFLFYFSNIFPYINKYFTKVVRLILLLLGFSLAFIGLFTNLIVKDVILSGLGQNTIYGPVYYIFSFYFLGLALWSFVLLMSRLRKTQGEEKIQLKLINIGLFTTLLFSTITNLIIPLTTGNSSISQIGPLGTSIFITFTAYAIIKHRLLNVKVITTEFFTVAISLIALFNVISYGSTRQLIIQSIIFIGVLIFSYLLVKSVLKEVKTREQMEELAVKLEVANDELKQLDQAKSDFINIASHQLRTPLTIVKGYISMINERTFGEVPKKLKDPLQKVYISNERLINLVADLLDLSRMERKKMQYSFQDTQITDVVHSLAVDFKEVAKRKGLKLIWKKPKKLPLVHADPQKLRQVFLNMIDNAIKYTDKGSVMLALAQQEGSVIFSIQDTGVGMSEEEARGLFKKFVRGKEISKSKTEGLGLGMYVAKLIIEDHHGEIWAESSGKDKGSTFFVKLPIANWKSEKTKQQEQVAEFLRNM